MATSKSSPYLRYALEDGLAKISGDGKTERIHYVAANHSERWADPEEKVRAEFWAELIYKYEYAPEKIRLEVKVPRRTPNDLADIVIYGDKDDDLKSPFFVIECKRADISDAEFTQSIEQACGNRASLGAPFCGAVAGMTRRFLRFDNSTKYPAGERDKNTIADVPVRYGKPPAWRFYKGGFRLESNGSRVAVFVKKVVRFSKRLPPRFLATSDAPAAG
jgi:type I restriction enzyme M protein